MSRFSLPASSVGIVRSGMKTHVTPEPPVECWGGPERTGVVQAV